MSEKVLIIQTAFIGDVILATALVESIHLSLPEAKIDFLLRKGNETLLSNNPNINEIIVWNKQENKYKNLYRIAKQIRKARYDYLINIQRFLSSGLIAAFSKARYKAGFKQNPLSIFFSKRVSFEMKPDLHEVDRNFQLVADFCEKKYPRPKLYPQAADYQKVEKYGQKPYICLAPASKWFTKQLSEYKWVELITLLDKRFQIFLLGGKEDEALCHKIRTETLSENVISLAGKLNFMESAALMEKAKMNYVNDSAPLHIASAVNAPVTAFFLSTVKDFGFYPLSDKAQIAQIDYDLYCRPCGIHGFAKCPEGHFRCSHDIEMKNYLVKFTD